MKRLWIGLFAFLTVALSPRVAPAQTLTPASAQDAPAGLTYDERQPPVENPRLFAGRRIAILAAHGVQKSELLFPYRYLAQRGAHVEILVPSWSEGRVLTVEYVKPHAWAQADGTFRDGLTRHYDLVLIAGGAWSSTVVRNDADALALIRAQAREGRWVAAICSGTEVLIDAGLARDRTLTGTPTSRTNLVNAGARYTARPAEIDRNVITGLGPEQLQAFAGALKAALAGR